MIIDQRGEDAEYQADANPNRLSFDKEINVAMTITSKCTRAEKHHNANDEQSKHRQEKNVSALTMHGSNVTFAYTKNCCCLAVSLAVFLCFCFGALARNQEFLANSQFPWIFDVIQGNQLVVGDIQFLGDCDRIVALFDDVTLSRRCRRVRVWFVRR